MTTLQAGTIAFLLNLCFVSCQIFNIEEYGAVGDGITDNTLAFFKTMTACSEAGGGQVFIPSGTFLTNPFEIVSDIVFFMDAGSSIIAYEEPNKWPSSSKCLICGTQLNNVTLTGLGVIDGRGSSWWLNPSQERPSILVIEKSSNLIINGITLQNSPMYHIVPSKCVNIEIFNIKILAPPSPMSHNTDGIDPEECQNVHIHDCYISNGDDNVAIKNGCKDILIENCIFDNGHGASIGSITEDTVSNITFRGITFNNTENGARVKSQPG
eukprot:TRINITY_DN8120_c0_g1_i1.p1 TRINITY_DN8120_c0_g1~~TRINITY_DN8120_c0_g1_i1.p1  ORF type:complete len:268 (-),score=40.16 TRINITY_DN8120_c0_g1_i1:486-1289(-)